MKKPKLDYTKRQAHVLLIIGIVMGGMVGSMGVLAADYFGVLPGSGAGETFVFCPEDGPDKGTCIMAQELYEIDRPPTLKP